MEGLIREEVLEQGGWRVFWRFFPYLYPVKDKALLMVLMTFIGVPLTQISVFMGRYLVDEVILATQKPVSWRMWAFFFITGLQALMWLIWRVMAYVRQVMSLAITVKVEIPLRRRFYAHLQHLSLNFLRTRPVGEHMYRTGEVGSLLPLIRDDAIYLVDIVYRMIWGAALVSLIDWKVTVLVLLYIIPHTIMAHYAYNYLQRVNAESRIWGQRATTVLRDSVAGVKTVKGFGRTDYQLLKYTRRLVDARRVGIKQNFLSILTHHFVLWIYLVLVGKVKWIYIGYETMVGNLTIGEFSVMFWLIWQLEGPMREIVQHIQNIRMHLVPAMRVLETLDVQPEIRDPERARRMPPVVGKVEFKHVTLEYVPGTPVLQDVSLTVEPGTFAALVGPSGAGKSSLLYLLLRLFDLSSGDVLVDGFSVRSVRLRTLLDQIGVVLQETFLYGGTVRDNLRYGNLHATDEQTREAVHLAGLEEFVAKLPNGLDTHIGEGTRLSGGERQRLGLARALIREPRILILDEPTAFLDSRTETSIMETFRQVMKSRTTLMVSHRLVPIRDADAIYVFRAGRIVEQGVHEDLVRQQGLYYTMWEEQTRLRGLEEHYGD
jgi:subfamily B ATP-binding cassette protein MsbA